jgi:hypothetical protein
VGQLGEVGGMKNVTEQYSDSEPNYTDARKIPLMLQTAEMGIIPHEMTLNDLHAVYCT